MTQNIIIALLVGLVAYQQWYYNKRMDVLMDRVMSNNIHEYKAATGQGPAPSKGRSPLNEAVKRYEENKNPL